MAIEHWMTAHLLGANGSFQRAAREYAEEYAAMAVAAERERCAALCEQTGPVAAQIYGDGAECLTTAELCAERIRGRQAAQVERLIRAGIAGD